MEAINERGWTIIEANDLVSLERFRAAFEQLVRSHTGAASASVQTAIGHCEPADLNKLFVSANYQLTSDYPLLLRAFAPTLTQLCGSRVFLQRRMYLRANIPGRSYTATPPHSDVFYGHSPHVFTLWVPLYDVTDGSGLYFYDKRTSSEITARYRFEQPLEEFLREHYPLPEGVPVRFGQAILFQCALVHGAHENTSSSPRVSFDTRIQSVDMPLYEKHFDLYGMANLA